MPMTWPPQRKATCASDAPRGAQAASRTITPSVDLAKQAFSLTTNHSASQLASVSSAPTPIHPRMSAPHGKFAVS